MIEFQCDNCNKIFTKKKDKGSINKFCSRICYYEWLKINYRPFPVTSGSAHPSYHHDVNHEAICEWCGKNYHIRAYRSKKGTSRFCSINCRREWYAEVWSQKKSWKLNRREFALNQLKNKSMNKVNSAPQKIINDLLYEKSIKYRNVEIIGSFSFDNYLFEHDLIIEVMGTYFHCDIRKFKEINYKNQLTRIKMDKIKHSFILSNYHTEILYLWEKDIMKNLKLCSLLINKYLENNGQIDNYHSINYEIIKNKLCLKNEIIFPYMEWNIEDVNQIVDIKLKEKISQKQIDKWITYFCYQCGKKNEQLITKYHKNERHFCSQKCFQKYKKENDWHRKSSPSSIVNKKK